MPAPPVCGSLTGHLNTGLGWHRSMPLWFYDIRRRSPVKRCFTGRLWPQQAPWCGAAVHTADDQLPRLPPRAPTLSSQSSPYCDPARTFTDPKRQPGRAVLTCSRHRLHGPREPLARPPRKRRPADCLCTGQFYDGGRGPVLTTLVTFRVSYNDFVL